MSVVLVQESERIRLRMASLRKSMNFQAARVAHSTQQLFDWKEQLKQYPGVLLAAGVFAGFIISPGRKVTPTVQLSPQSMEEIMARNGSHLKQEASVQSVVVSGALRVLTGVALSGLSVLARKSVERFVQAGSVPSHGQPEPRVRRNENAAGRA